MERDRWLNCYVEIIICTRNRGLHDIHGFLFTHNEFTNYVFSTPLSFRPKCSTETEPFFQYCKQKSPQPLVKCKV